MRLNSSSANPTLVSIQVLEHVCDSRLVVFLGGQTEQRVGVTQITL